MGKLKGRSLPRKLKKEFVKIECIERPAAWVKSSLYPLDNIKFKKGTKKRKWTSKLEESFRREKLALQTKYFKEQNEYLDESLRQKISIEEFRNEYRDNPVMLGEPNLIGNGLSASERSQIEFIGRMNLYLSSVEYAANLASPILKLKAPNLSEEEAKKFASEWNVNIGLTLVSPKEGVEEAEVKMKTFHILHNHPQMEAKICSAKEVIVDVEYQYLFNHYEPVFNPKTGELIEGHIIVDVEDYKQQIRYRNDKGTTRQGSPWT